MTKSQRVTWKALAIRAMFSHPKKKATEKRTKKTRTNKRANEKRQLE